ncbi:unnamed protein product [Rotaria sp. Silwood2]|nr:unnamed protein product [Rotaria sp. Silwood2]CAF2768920.1 unnamed protein product [Rotaria sp. Silwood2]CAF3056543.1 unnamed protein product [Rotaria sp. Silwood2]CAF3081647.1 unnamed protein product [Rotaria sp. Silwood2]CAF4165816.1 unnamed protein product [Rotaria sp. Silwood2]
MKSIGLILVDTSPKGLCKSLIINKHFRHVLNLTQIHHMEIQKQIFIGKLSEILYLLPELDSLQIYSLSFSQSIFARDDTMVQKLEKNDQYRESTFWFYSEMCNQ